MKHWDEGKYIKIEATPTDKGLKNIFVRTEHGYVHFRSIRDARVVWLLDLLKTHHNEV